MRRPSTGYLLIPPAILPLAMLIAYPMACTVLLSVSDPKGDYVGLKNFHRMLVPRATPTAFRDTLV